MSVSRQELVGWPHNQIAEQKRLDAATSGAPMLIDGPHIPLPSKETAISSNIQLLLPVDAKKQRKQVKQLFYDRGKLPPHDAVLRQVDHANDK